MYRDWQFFRSMIDNAQMSLAKSDPLVFLEYLTLAEADDQRQLAQSLQVAYNRTITLLEQVTGQALLENEPRLRESIRLRNPYIDPIHRIQVELLRRVREAGGTAEEKLAAEEYGRALLLTLQGISAGVRNTG